jgi:hypothetical protein
VRSLPPASEFHLFPGTASLHSATMTTVDGETVRRDGDQLNRRFWMPMWLATVVGP